MFYMIYFTSFYIFIFIKKATAEEIEVTKDEVLPEDFIFGHLYLLSRCFSDEYEKIQEYVKVYYRYVIKITKH